MASPLASDTILTLPKNITIRRYRRSDAPSLSHHGTSPAIWANLSDRMPHPYTEADALWWLDFNEKPENQAPSGPYDDSTRTCTGPKLPASYAITVDGEAVGSIGLEFGEMDSVYRRSASLGYWLGEAYWGRGVMSVVAPAFVEWMWQTFDVVLRLNGSVLAGNAASASVLRKCGMEYEGRRKAFTVKNGKLKDEELYGVVRPGLVLDC